MGIKASTKPNNAIVKNFNNNGNPLCLLNTEMLTTQIIIIKKPMLKFITTSELSPEYLIPMIIDITQNAIPPRKVMIPDMK